MKCTEYAPLVSRYVDEDLEGRELEAFLDHLSGCAACLKEMEEVERLRGWLQAADATQGVPEIRGSWRLEDLLGREAPSDVMDPAAPPVPGAVRETREGKRARSRKRSWPGRAFFPLPTVPRPVMRLVFPLLVVGLAAAWLYTREESDWIDVHDLQSVPAASVSFPQEEGEEIEYYVVQHATHQPWMQYGDEVLMLQLASMPSR